MNTVTIKISTLHPGRGQTAVPAKRRIYDLLSVAIGRNVTETIKIETADSPPPSRASSQI